MSFPLAARMILLSFETAVFVIMNRSIIWKPEVKDSASGLG